MHFSSQRAWISTMPLVGLEKRYKSRCPQEGLQNFLVDAEKHSLLCATYGLCKDTLPWSGIQVSNFGWTSNFESNLGWISFNFDVFIFVMWGERYFCTTTSWSDSGLSLLFALVLLTSLFFTFAWLPFMWMEQMKGFNSLSKLVNRFALILDLHSFQERLLDACYGTILLSLGQSLFVFIFISFYGKVVKRLLFDLWFTCALLLQSIIIVPVAFVINVHWI